MGDVIELIETWDPKFAKWATTLTEEEYFNLRMTFDEDDDEADIIHAKNRLKQDFAKLRYAARRFAKSTNCSSSVYYRRGKGIDFGRRYPTCSGSMATLMTMPKIFRGAACRDIHIDIDCVNCQPTLIVHECKNRGVECKLLTQYVSNTAEIRERVAAELGVSVAKAKQEILRILNDDGRKLKNAHIKGRWLEKFQCEVACIQQQFAMLLSDASDPLHKIWQHVNILKGETENRPGSLISHIFQNAEETMLYKHVMDYFKRTVWLVRAAIHDGLHVEKRGLGEEPDYAKLSAYVSDKMGVQLRFERKQFDSSLVVPDVLSEAQDYETVAKELYENHVKVCGVFIERDPVTGFLGEQFTRQQMQEYYADVEVIYKGKPRSFGDLVLLEPRVPKYKKQCVHRLDKSYDKTLNLRQFYRFETEIRNGIVGPMDQEGMRFGRLWIQDVMPNDYESIERWVANLIQHPDDKPGVIPHLYSVQGTGKTAFMRMLQLMLGEEQHVKLTADPDRDFGQFNSLLLKTKLVLVSERLSDKSYQMLKSLSTDSHVAVNQKGVDVKTIESNHAVIFGVNSITDLKIEVGDRRIWVIEFSDVYVNDRDAYTAIFSRFINNEPALRAYYHFLRNMQGVPKAFTGFDIPRSKLRNELTWAKMHPAARFIRDCVSAHLDSGAVEDEISVPSTEEAAVCFRADMKAYINFYSAYREFATRCGHRHIHTKEEVTAVIRTDFTLKQCVRFKTPLIEERRCPSILIDVKKAVSLLGLQHKLGPIDAYLEPPPPVSALPDLLRRFNESTSEQTLPSVIA